MAWGRIDDKLHSHPKTMRIPRSRRCEAMGLWALADSWCNDHETDGHVPRDMVDEFGTDAEVAQLLIGATMWEATEDGYRFVNWSEYNFTAAQLQEKRDAESARKRRWRESKKGSSEGSPVNVPSGQSRPSHVSPDGVPAESPLSHTRTRTHTQEEEQETCAPAAPETRSTDYPPAFEAFWSHYPKKSGKRQALNAWRKASKRATQTELIAGADRYRADPNRNPGFTKNAEGWLNGDGWLDEPLPARGQARQMTAREQSFLDLERMKDNPNPEVLRRAGLEPSQPQFRAIQGGAQ